MILRTGSSGQQTDEDMARTGRWIGRILGGAVMVLIIIAFLAAAGYGFVVQWVALLVSAWIIARVWGPDLVRAFLVWRRERPKSITFGATRAGRKELYEKLDREWPEAMREDARRRAEKNASKEGR